MTSQDTEALKALVALAKKYDHETELGHLASELEEQICESVLKAIPALERMLASQGEAVLGNVPPLYPQPSPGESITVTYEESPPLAESMGDAEAALELADEICHYISEHKFDTPGVAAIIRRHMQQGK